MLCPICKKPFAKPGSDEQSAKYLPFCSDRCQLIDLGRWLDGKYQIPVADPQPEHDPADSDFTR